MLQHCHAINAQFADPLPFVEIPVTAHSIGKWIWDNFNEDTYRARQAPPPRKQGRQGQRQSHGPTKLDLATALDCALCARASPIPTTPVHRCLRTR
ncbi:hypothetical protein BFN03_08240 [Rhodococcus sp. WMMA185]|nr:hypothetical protein BFN03_08240 [Rhodococcus sp. WMMA185]